MTLDLDEIIKHVTAKTGFGLCRDDPETAFAEVINLLTEHQQAEVAAALEKYRDVHEGLALQWRHDAKNVANSILNAALETSRAEMAKAMGEGAKQVVRLAAEANGKALEEHRKAITELLRDMKTFAIWMTAVAALAVLAAALLNVWMKTG